MYAFRLCQKLWRVILSEKEMIDCSGDPDNRSVRNGKDVIPFPLTLSAAILRISGTQGSNQQSFLYL